MNVVDSALLSLMPAEKAAAYIESLKRKDGVDSKNESVIRTNLAQAISYFASALQWPRISSEEIERGIAAAALALEKAKEFD